MSYVGKYSIISSSNWNQIVQDLQLINYIWQKLQYVIQQAKIIINQADLLRCPTLVQDISYIMQNSTIFMQNPQTIPSTLNIPTAKPGMILTADMMNLLTNAVEELWNSIMSTPSPEISIVSGDDIVTSEHWNKIVSAVNKLKSFLIPSQQVPNFITFGLTSSSETPGGLNSCISNAQEGYVLPNLPYTVVASPVIPSYCSAISFSQSYLQNPYPFILPFYVTNPVFAIVIYAPLTNNPYSTYTNTPAGFVFIGSSEIGNIFAGSNYTGYAFCGNLGIQNMLIFGNYNSEGSFNNSIIDDMIVIGDSNIINSLDNSIIKNLKVVGNFDIIGTDNNSIIGNIEVIGNNNGASSFNNSIIKNLKVVGNDNYIRSFGNSIMKNVKVIGDHNHVSVYTASTMENVIIIGNNNRIKALYFSVVENLFICGEQNWIEPPNVVNLYLCNPNNSIYYSPKNIIQNSPLCQQVCKSS